LVRRNDQELCLLKQQGEGMIINPCLLLFTIVLSEK
jgi:hypothetical protein